MDKLDLMIAKHAGEQDVKRRMASLRDDADQMLDEMARDHAAEHHGAYLDSYGAICKTELGYRILTKREECSRVIEAQPSY